jgi:NADPH:quinone reductase-like Zn-dependent oxidoreductase
MKAAGVRRFGEPVQVLELPGSPMLRPDEVLIEVRACGVGNWDEFARTGDWDLGRRPPMALGVEAAGLVAATGDQVREVKAGDRVTAHSVPLREQGAWAERFVAAAMHRSRLSRAGLARPGARGDRRRRWRGSQRGPRGLGRGGTGGARWRPAGHDHGGPAARRA